MRSNWYCWIYLCQGILVSASAIASPQVFSLSVQSLLNVILTTVWPNPSWSSLLQRGLCVQLVAGICLCHVTAQSSFPTTINVSYFLNPLILVCTCPQLRVEMIIKEEFEPVISPDLLRLRLGWIFFFFFPFFYVKIEAVPHLRRALEPFSSVWKRWLVVFFAAGTQPVSQKNLAYNRDFYC